MSRTKDRAFCAMPDSMSVDLRLSGDDREILDLIQTRCSGYPDRMLIIAAAALETEMSVNIELMSEFDAPYKGEFRSAYAKEFDHCEKLHSAIMRALGCRKDAHGRWEEG